MCWLWRTQCLGFEEGQCIDFGNDNVFGLKKDNVLGPGDRGTRVPGRYKGPGDMGTRVPGAQFHKISETTLNTK